jgi:hypothetical protein
MFSIPNMVQSIQYIIEVPLLLHHPDHVQGNLNWQQPADSKTGKIHCQAQKNCFLKMKPVIPEEIHNCSLHPPDADLCNKQCEQAMQGKQIQDTP